MSVNALAWYYAPGLRAGDQTAVLTEDEWHHAHHVLRLHPGDRLILFDGKGHCYEAQIDKARKSEGELLLLRDLSASFAINNQLNLIAAFAPTKNVDRVEYAVEKLTEMGASQIVFLDCDHGERTRVRMDRMHKIAISAAKQSRKLLLPLLRDFIAPMQLLEEIKTIPASGGHAQQVLCCHLDSTSIPIYKNYSSAGDVIVLVGPEGGFSTGEIEAMRSADVSFVSLGPHRLRAETAIIVATAQLMLLHEMK